MCEDINSNWSRGGATFGTVDERKNCGGKKKQRWKLSCSSPSMIPKLEVTAIRFSRGEPFERVSIGENESEGQVKCDHTERTLL